MKKLIIMVITGLLLLCMTGLTQASLIIVGQAEYNSNTYNLIYENDQNLVWLDYSRVPAYQNDPIGTWSSQNAWANELSVDVVLNPGFTTTIDLSTGWRLPSAAGETHSGYDHNTSEMGHLFYDSLGKAKYYPLGDASPFANLFSAKYWSGTASGGNAWMFDFNGGYQSLYGQNNTLHAIAVHPATISNVPIPGAVWLLGSGLFGLVAVRRRKNNIP